ncbi:YraN family protein [Shewanella sp. VB17]|uniref:YraN family protein n=1 Tax=Shewanella sp. VB17 TaxID=2739432 RepID=UPI001564E844|nr:YraN family protein [Shewanella sp. VB17]NRD75664.1 YraN family protein [Shewanella sp. VB17]
MDTKKHTAQAHGRAGESLAMNFLLAQGLSFIEANVRYKFGEIDLVMKEGKKWVFIEVKYRSKKHYGGAINALTTAQTKRLRRAAEHYIQLNKIDAICRFDLIAIDADEVQWLTNIF